MIHFKVKTPVMQAEAEARAREHVAVESDIWDGMTE
jgi:hypothetical protein